MISQLFMLLLFAAPLQATAASGVCTAEEDATAESIMGKVKDWDSLYRTFGRVANCDNGGTSEFNNDVVLHLLAKQWPGTRRQFELIADSSRFREFVLKHISATSDLSELKRVRKNAKKLCITGEDAICSAIASRAKLAIDDLSSNGVK